MRSVESKVDIAVDVKNLTKYYGQFLAVDHISFAVKNGEIFGFLGPNGAGKTTTIRILTGVLGLDDGSASIFGYKVGSLNAKQITGVLPEMANAYWDLSGWNNLMLMAELYGVPIRKAREKAAELLQATGLFTKKDEKAIKYSKGMIQRLILCMALISEPQILFLDEPTSGLDVQSARLINDMLRSLNTNGKTIFLTTHDIEEANQLCNRVCIINEGKIVALDTPERIRLATSSMYPVEVSFIDSVSVEDLAKLPGVNAVKTLGDKYRLYTAKPADLVTALINYSYSSNLRILSLNTLAPSLEDAFVALTERTVK